MPAVLLLSASLAMPGCIYHDLHRHGWLDGSHHGGRRDGSDHDRGGWQHRYDDRRDGDGYRGR